MKSNVFIGRVTHSRLVPQAHSFQYPLYVYGLVLQELETLDRTNPFFGYNRFAPVRINDADYLQPGREKIYDKLVRHLKRQGIQDDLGEVILVTAARYWNYIFNPVSFYFCYAPAGNLLCVVAEVNNTYGDRHLYTLTGDRPEADNHFVCFSAGKALHVSPFNPMAGAYRFRMADIRNTLDIQVQLIMDEKTVFHARLSGSPRPLTPGELLQTMLRYPVTPFLTVPRIFLQAARLSLQKKLPFNDRPIPQKSPMTVRKRPATLLQRLCMKGILTFLQGITVGSLALELPDGKRIILGPDGPVQGEMKIQDYGFFNRTLLAGGDIGLGESYMAGEWESDDLVGVFKVLIDNRDRLADGNFATALLSRLRERYAHLGHRNTVNGSRNNIQRHYDLGNDFYELFLDRSMNYSCAFFRSPGESLEAAQVNKLHAIIEKAGVQAQDHVLEIGCGWGALALEAARKTGCQVTGITISQAQYEYAKARVKAAGLEDRITILLQDYRQIQGRFDKILSIEMLEAVGRENYGTFFQRCEQLLAPGGVMVLQVITIPDHRYERYRRERDWIQKHIFPGGILPSLAVLTQAMARASQFVVQHAENIGWHYAATLKEWRKRFTSNLETLPSLGFDTLFQRKWIYYLAICEAAFDRGVLGDMQLVFSRPGDTMERKHHADMD